VIKSMSYDYKPKRPDAAAERLNSIRGVTERKSTAELVISTIPTSRHSNWAPFLRPTTTGSVMAEYRIHVPRDSKLRAGRHHALATARFVFNRRED
jgi:hypothetical protein